MGLLASARNTEYQETHAANDALGRFGRDALEKPVMRKSIRYEG